MSDESTRLVLEAIGALKDDLGALKGELREWQAAVNGRLDAIDRRLDAIDRRLDGHDQRFDELKRDLRAELHQVRAQIMERVDRLSDEFKATRDDITVNFGRADKAERIAKNAADETQAAWDQMRAIERLVHNLAGRLADLERRYDRDRQAP